MEAQTFNTFNTFNTGFDMGEEFVPALTIIVIDAYSRAQAIEDGELVDVSEAAREKGIRYPVAVTRAVWQRLENFPAKSGQCLTGRLHDMLWMLYLTIRVNKDESCILFRFLLSGRYVNLKAVCGPGDDFEPVITVMEPGED